MTVKRIIILCSSFVFLGVIFDAVSVSAAVQGKWINSGTIEIGGTQYIDGKPDDSDRSYYKDGKDDQAGNCSQVSVVRDISSDNARGRLYPLKTHSSGLGCEPDTSRGEDVTFDPATVANATSAKSPDDESSDSCESHGGMAWLFCPVIKLLDATMNVVDTQIQAMLDVDSNKYLNAELKQSWSTIRNIAYIVLIPITLVMVIGTAVGSSMIDAYTVKKAMPRLAIAVIFIALSYEICIFLIGLFNTVGYGMIGLLTSPFGDSISTLSLADLFGTSREGVGGGVLSAILAIPKIAVAGIAILLLLWFFGTTFLLFAGAAFLVLMIRQLFIVGLVLLAPIAILAWIFPGNDKLWKSWWGLFSKLLIMFPLIMGIIAVGRIFAFIINQERGGGLEGSLLTPFTKLAAYMLPYAFIPFTFKFAGGIFANIAGVVNDKEKGLFDRQRKKRAEKYEREIGRKVLQKRADWQNRVQKAASNENLGRFGRLAMRQAARGIGGYNVQAADSARRAAIGKELNEQIATGRDDEIRGLTVNRNWALSQAQAQRRSDGTWTDGEWRVNNGVREFKTLGGAWVNEAAVLDGQKRWGGDTYAQQTALSYEMRKATTEDELQGLAKRFSAVATGTVTDPHGNRVKVGGGWSMSDNQAAGAWIGAAFENQNQHLEYKYTDWQSGNLTKDKDFVKEIYEKKGSYPLAQMSSHTIERLKQAYAAAEMNNDEDTKNRIYSISETFMHEAGLGGGQVGAIDANGGQQPIMAQPGAARGPAGTRERITSTPGAAHVAERVRELAEITGAKQNEPGGFHVNPSNAYGQVSPNRREHK